MKFVTITSLYPNQQQTRHGIFIENRLRKFKERYPETTVEVIAPIPWFPFAGVVMASRRNISEIPFTEQRHDIKVYHPRYFSVPGIGMYLNPIFMFICLLWFHFRHKHIIGNKDIIDGHYIYPDGVAISWFARLIKKPFMLTARGNDISLLPKYFIVKQLIVSALNRANCCAAVCEALLKEMRLLAPKQTNCAVLRNGVDLEQFKPLAIEHRTNYRSEKSLNDHYVLLCVGHFIERKGQYLLIEAIKPLKNVSLLLAGDGEMEPQLRQLVKQLSLVDRVHFLGHRTPQQLVEDYNAADLLVLPSSREGWANVLLEAMACGTKVLATDVWGTPEVVRHADAGMLLKSRTVEALTHAIDVMQNTPSDRAATRRYAEHFSWDETSNNIYRIFQEMLHRNQ